MICDVILQLEFEDHAKQAFAPSIGEQDLQAKAHYILEDMMLMMRSAASTIPLHVSGRTIHHRAYLRLHHVRVVLSGDARIS